MFNFQAYMGRERRGNAIREDVTTFQQLDEALSLSAVADTEADAQALYAEAQALLNADESILKEHGFLSVQMRPVTPQGRDPFWAVDIRKKQQFASFGALLSSLT